MPSLSSPARLSPIALILLAGCLVRGLVVWTTADVPPRIADERHYLELATSLVEGRGFAFSYGLTSLRPPLYPAVIAGTWTATGTQSLVAVRALQIIFGLATAWLVFLIGRRVYDERAGLAAAAIVAFYPTLVFANALILTETLFALLVVLVVWLAIRLVDRPSLVLGLATGMSIGLAALTRSVLWPFPVVLAAIMLWAVRAPLIRRFAIAAAIVAGFAGTVAPWAVRNTRLQRVPVLIDTMGGMNLRMGNYAYTPHDRIWDAVSMQGEKLWIVGLPPEAPDGGEWTEGQKERWARDRAIEFMLANPGLTAWRAAIKFGDFWGLDRDFIAGVERGLYAPPLWVTATAGAAMLLAYPLVITLTLGAIALAPPSDRRAHVIMLVLVIFVCALHTIVFGHPRYRLPLMPILAVYAGAAVTRLEWAAVRNRAAWPAMAGAGVLMALWAVQFAVRDWTALARLLRVVS